MSTTTPIYKTCPFCGAEPTVKTYPQERVEVSCENSLCLMNSVVAEENSVEQAAAHWNRRSESASVQPDSVLVSRSFLEATPCPNANCCDGMITSTGPDPMHEPCQWCYEKHMILSGAERA